MRGAFYTDDEFNIMLAGHAAGETAEIVAPRLPGRTLASVKAQMISRGLVVDRPSPRKSVAATLRELRTRTAQRGTERGRTAAMDMAFADAMRAAKGGAP